MKNISKATFEKMIAEHEAAHLVMRIHYGLGSRAAALTPERGEAYTQGIYSLEAGIMLYLAGLAYQFGGKAIRGKFRKAHIDKKPVGCDPEYDLLQVYNIILVTDYLTRHPSETMASIIWQYFCEAHSILIPYRGLIKMIGQRLVIERYLSSYKIAAMVRIWRKKHPLIQRTTGRVPDLSS